MCVEYANLMNWTPNAYFGIAYFGSVAKDRQLWPGIVTSYKYEAVGFDTSCSLLVVSERANGCKTDVNYLLSLPSEQSYGSWLFKLFMFAESKPFDIYVE